MSKYTTTALFWPRSLVQVTLALNHQFICTSTTVEGVVNEADHKQIMYIVALGLLHAGSCTTTKVKPIHACHA